MRDIRNIINDYAKIEDDVHLAGNGRAIDIYFETLDESKKSTRKSLSKSDDDINNTAYFDRVVGELHSWYVCYVEDYKRKYEYGFKNEKECINWIKKNGFDLDPSMTESKKSTRKSIKESKTNYLTVEEFCNLCAKVFIHYEIWSLDGHNRYEESYDLSKIKYCPYKHHNVLMWDFNNDVLILYIENNAIPF